MQRRDRDAKSSRVHRWFLGHPYLSSDHLVDQHTQCPPVHRGTVRAPQDNLGRDVVRGAAEGLRGGRASDVLLAHAKVGNFDVAIASNHHVVKFQIPARIRDCIYFDYGKTCKMYIYPYQERHVKMSVAGTIDG